MNIRRTRGWVAFALACSLIASALLSFVGTSAAHADNNPNIDVTITKLVRVDGGTREYPDGPLYVHHRALLEFRYDATDSQPNPGDSFSLTLPPEFKVLEVGKKAALTSGDIDAGACVLGSETQVTCTFSDGILGKTDIKGTGELRLMAVKETSEDEVSLTVNGSKVPVPTPGGIVRAPHQYTPRAAKWMGSVLTSAQHINWDLLFNTTLLPSDVPGAPNNVTEVVWKDTLSAGQYFSTEANRWQLRMRDRQGEPRAVYTLLAYKDKPVANAEGQFTLSVEFNNPEKPTEATITARGPFQHNANYYINYRTLPDTPDNHPQAGVVYGNDAQLLNTSKEYKKSSSGSYLETFTVTIEMSDGFGGFEVAKKLTGDSLTEVKPGTTFQVQAAWQLPGGRTPADYPGWDAPTNPVTLDVEVGKTIPYPATFPVGTQITLTEDVSSATPASPVGWGEPSFVVDGGTPAPTATFTIDNKSSTVVELTNEAKPGAPGTVSIGDYVWLDANRDGVQDDTEQPLDGVRLTLTGPDGQPVTDVNGAPVTDTTTDAEGRYLFENLPVLTDGQSYTVTVTAPEGYEPTAPGAAARDRDSSTGAATSEGLTKDGESDLTLDFGFVKEPAGKPSVSVGDYVWLDANRNGVQDAGEKPIKGVTVTLAGPDGQPVTDVNGAPVTPTKTAEDGTYSFDALPVLKPDESYRVSVVTPAGMSPTKATATARDKDSSTGYADSGDLTRSGERDATLDFGFVEPAAPGDEPSKPRNPNKPGLPRTGD